MDKVLVGGVLIKAAYVQVGAAELLPAGAGGGGRGRWRRRRSAQAGGPGPTRRSGVRRRRRRRVGRRSCRGYSRSGRPAAAAHRRTSVLQKQGLRLVPDSHHADFSDSAFDVY